MRLFARMLEAVLVVGMILGTAYVGATYVGNQVKDSIMASAQRIEDSN